MVTRHLSSRCIKCILILTFLHFCVILPLLYHDSPFSMYFRFSGQTYESMANTVKVKNQKRMQLAMEYFDSMLPEESRQYYTTVANRTSIYMAVPIVTVSRNSELSESSNKIDNLGYLLQSSSAVDRFARSGDFVNNTLVFVCNVDIHPDAHKQAKYLKSFLPFTERYGSSSFHIPDVKLPDQSDTYRNKIHKGTYEKENYDYSYCLKVAKSFNPKYVLMVEDDAVPHQDLAVVLKYILEKHLSLKKNDFGYLKLYYPEKWQGFAFEDIRILELISIGCVGGGIWLMCLLLLLRNKKISRKSMIVYYIVGVLFTILTIQLVGRQNIMEFRRLSKYFYKLCAAPGCCTPAMLYPTSAVDPLTSHLTFVPSSTHTDIVIAHHFQHRHMKVYQLEPNLFHHIGKHSSLTNTEKEPKHFLI